MPATGRRCAILPVALATFGDPGKAEPWTLGQGRATHHHPLSDSACLALVGMVHILLGGGSKEETRGVADALVEKHKGFRFVPYPGQCTPYVVDTLQTVLHFYFSTEFFADCVIQTVNQGGDADTTGAIAGHAGRRHLRNERHPRELAWEARCQGGRRDPPAGAGAARDLRGGRRRSGQAMNFGGDCSIASLGRAVPAAFPRRRSSDGGNL